MLWFFCAPVCKNFVVLFGGICLFFYLLEFKAVPHTGLDANVYGNNISSSQLVNSPIPSCLTASVWLSHVGFVPSFMCFHWLQKLISFMVCFNVMHDKEFRTVFDFQAVAVTDFLFCSTWSAQLELPSNKNSGSECTVGAVYSWCRLLLRFLLIY